MTEQERPTLPGARVAGAFVLLVVGGFGALLVVYFLLPEMALGVPAAYAVPVVLVPGVLLALVLAWVGEGYAPSLAVVLGVVFILGGAAFDIIATVIHTPDLSLEGNPIARALLDSGHSVAFVYGYAAVCETLWLLMQCLLWVAFLRHRRAFTASLRGPWTAQSFIKAAKDAYCLLWLLTAVLLVGGGVDRWYLGLQWFRLVPDMRSEVMGVGMFAGLAWYLAWLWHATRPAEGG